MTTFRATMGALIAIAIAATAAFAIAITRPGASGIDESTSLQPVPEWFAPIAASYRGDVTPSFDFASLYGMQTSAYFAPISRYYHGRVGQEFDFASLYPGAE